MRIFLLIISLLFPCGLIAQITLSGRVVSVQQQPLQGVTVVDKISGKWAFTNDKGEFSLFIKNTTLALQCWDCNRKQSKEQQPSLIPFL